VWVLACLVVAAVAVAVVVLSRGGDGEAAARAADARVRPECANGSPRTSMCPHNTSFKATDYAFHGPAAGAGTPGSDPPGGKRRVRRPYALGVVGVVACAVALTSLLSGGGDSGAIAGTGPGKGYLKAIHADAATCKTVVQRSWRCPDKKRFDPPTYVTHGDAFDCINFASQADAQAVLKADPRDPNQLDPYRDGVACPWMPEPFDRTSVQASAKLFRWYQVSQRSARCPQPWRTFDPAQYVGNGVDEFDCKAFASQADAQAVLRFSPQDPNHIDGDGDGIACPDLPAPKDLHRVNRTPPGG
jgi:hypothetical protein